MKVVCVDDGPARSLATTQPMGHVVHGETYTILNVREDLGGIGYELVEKPTLYVQDGKIEAWAWDSKRFVPADYFESEFAVTEQKPQLEPATI